MILQRFLDGLLTVLSWLLDVLFARVMLIAVLVSLALASFLLLIAWRGRMRSAAVQPLPPVVAVVMAGKPEPPTT